MPTNFQLTPLIDWALVRAAERRYHSDPEQEQPAAEREILECVRRYLIAATERELMIMRREMYLLRSLTYGERMPEPRDDDNSNDWHRKKPLERRARPLTEPSPERHAQSA